MRIPCKVIFGVEARQKLLKGINTVADAVASTLGPKSFNVAINEASGVPKIIKDGANVAKRIDLFDEFEDMGAQLLKEAATQTETMAGDGTTTATIIAQSLINQAVENITAGKNSMVLKEEIEEAGKILVKELKKLSKPVKKHQEIERVANISSANVEIGKTVADVFKKVGKNGVVRVEQGKTYETYVEYKRGVEFDRGYASSSDAFITDRDRAEAVVENPFILLTDIKTNHTYQIIEFLNKFVEYCKTNNLPPHLMIIGEVQETALHTVVINHLREDIPFNALVVQAPAYGSRRLDELEDLSIVVGGRVIRADSGRELKSVEIEELGRAEKIIVEKDKTIIQGGQGDDGRLKSRIKELDQQIEIANTEYDKQVREERRAKLTGEMATIWVGATTEAEIDDKKERFRDAIEACKSATEEGIVAGGQVAFMYLSQQDFWPDSVGAKVLRKAIREPFKILIENTGLDYAENLGKITPIKYPIAIDVNDGLVKDMIEAGIIDPTKVGRCAIENAISVAGMAITTKTLISQPYKENEK
ncbi:MAG: chaperonin GroEL [Patescibacteria group bacterium]